MHARQPIAAAILAAALPLGGCGDKAPPAKPHVPEVRVLTLAPRSMPIVYEQPGQTAGFREVEVRARVTGILVKRVYTEGRPVKEGEVLFEIDPAPFRATLDQARGALRQSEAALERAIADRDRITPLFAENAVSRKDFDDANSNFESAKAAVDSARAKVREAEINLAYTTVTAPISGFASREARSEGSLVSAGGDASLLTTIAQLDPLYVNFSIAEAEMLSYTEQVRAGRISPPADKRYEVRVKLADGSLSEIRGRMDFADARVDPKTGTIRARAEFANPQARLLPGQFVRVRVSVGELQGALAVPVRAITQAQATRLVLVVDAAGKVEARPVTLGPTIGDEVVIYTGVKAGDRVVVDGLMKARPGSPVKAVPVSHEEATQPPRSEPPKQPPPPKA